MQLDLCAKCAQFKSIFIIFPYDRIVPEGSDKRDH